VAKGYDHKEIEKRAQEKWASFDLYTTDLTDSSKDPYYLLFEFPYPSGDLHIGHWYAFAVTDIYARYLRMKGKNVLFPFGFDSFGLPAENAAMKNGADPKEWTYANMERMRGQVKSMGTSVDWSKEIVTSDPEYYKWTQWLFAKLFEHGLAERREAPVKWCPKDQTVLANEQVIDGRCERCGTEVVEKRLTQWFMKITQYAERLLADLEPLPWREDIKEAQRQWIGKSEGAKLVFPIEGREESVEVFTTRADTVFGATYVVLAPEHPLVSALPAKNAQEVSAYVEATKKKTERERSENKEKTGVRLEGVTAVNPATKEQIPVYVADYVLGSYGTGAVMAVPAHDERDFEFATRHNLPIRTVIEPVFVTTDGNDRVRPETPTVERNSISAIIRNPVNGKYLALKWKKADWVTAVTGGIEAEQTPEEAALAEIREETGYKNVRLVRTLTTVHSSFFHIPKNENRFGHFHTFIFELTDEERDELSAEEQSKHDVVWMTSEEMRTSGLKPSFVFSLDELERPSAYTGDGYLTNSGQFSGRDNREVMSDIIAAAGGERVTNYRIRDWLVSRQRYWGCPIPVVYDPEGKPHLVPSEHLPWLLPTDVDFTPTGKAPLASSKELHERVEKIFGKGWTPEYDTLDTFVDSSWYFLRYLDPKDEHDFSDASLMKKWLPVDRYSGGSEHTTMHLLYARFFHKALYDLALVPTPEPFEERFNRGIILGTDGQKMSKRWGNVVNPDEVVAEFGTDAVRMYLAFIGPYNETGHYPWNLDGVSAMRRFLERVIALGEKLDESQPSEAVLKLLAKAEAKSAADSERFKFNTALSALMVLVRDMEGLPKVPKPAYLDLLTFVAPFAPHITEALWEKSGGEGSIHAAKRPTYDAAYLEEDTVTVAVQVAGKRRGDISLSPEAEEAEATAAALQIPAVRAALGGKTPSRVVYVKGKILNLVP
jgi:leucyl-tRNA synthetase